MSCIDPQTKLSGDTACLLAGDVLESGPRMTGSNSPSDRLHSTTMWLAVWLVVALLVAGFVGASHAGHADDHSHHHACAVCLLTQGNLLADGGVGQGTVLVLALVFFAFITDTRSVSLARLGRPSGRGPPR